jgi:hypothetical protein
VSFFNERAEAHTSGLRQRDWKRPTTLP